MAQEINVYLIPSPSATAIESFIPAFEEATGIKVNVTETPYGEAHQKLLLSVQLDQGQYDVAQFDNTFLAPFGAAGTMQPLDEQIAGSAEYDIADFAQGQQDYGKYDGQTLGLTLSTEPMIQWYRTDIYEELGLEPATTWDEYMANARAVADSGLGDGNIIGWGPNASWWWMTLVWSFGGHLYDADLNPTVNSPEAVEATTFMKDLLAYGPDGGISASGDDTTNKFLSQDIGAMIQYSGYWGVALDPANSAFVGNIGTAPMPMGAVDITHLAGWNIGIPADAKNPDDGWKFLEFVLGKSNAVDYLKAGAAAIGREVDLGQRGAAGAASLPAAPEHPRREPDRALPPDPRLAGSREGDPRRAAADADRGGRDPGRARRAERDAEADPRPGKRRLRPGGTARSP